MNQPPSTRLRNIGLVAHINAGKTTLSEAILHRTGQQPWQGRVDHGTAATDHLVEEQRRGISIVSAVVRVPWQDCEINLIDTPGHIDFSAEVTRCLRVLDGLIVVVDAVRGVEAQTEAVWREADRWGVPRLVFLNKLDRRTADWPAALNSVGERLDTVPALISEPLTSPKGDHEWLGLLDVIRGIATSPQGDPMDTPSHAQAARHELWTSVAEHDDELLQAFAEDREVSDGELMAGLRRATWSGKVAPVLAGSALDGSGVGQLLDAVRDLLPAPPERPQRPAHDTAGARHEADPAPKADAPLAALVFQDAVEEGRPEQTLRVFRGELATGDRVACGSRGLEFQVRDVWLPHAGEVRPPTSAMVGPGEVVRIEGPAELRTGDTLHAPSAPIRLERPPFPRPVLHAALEPEQAEDEGPLLAVAERLAQADPTLEIRRDPATGQLQVAGMGELHLEVFGERLRRRFDRAFRIGRPVAERAFTVSGRGIEELELHIRPGGEDVAARVRVEVLPAPGLGVATVDLADPPAPEGRATARADGAKGARGAPAMDPGSDPDLDPDLGPALARSLRDAARVAWVGHPAPLDLKVVVHELRVDPVPASVPEGVFDREGFAAHALDQALARALWQAGTVELEPRFRYEVQCPQEVLSGVLADLKARGAEPDSVAAGMLGARVTGVVALPAILGYATELRSRSRGQGVIDLVPDGFAPVVGGRSGPAGGVNSYRES